MLSKIQVSFRKRKSKHVKSYEKYCKPCKDFTIHVDLKPGAYDPSLAEHRTMQVCAECHLVGRRIHSILDDFSFSSEDIERLRKPLQLVVM